MSSAQPGHNAQIAVEVDGAAAGTFTNVAELTSDNPFEMTRESSEVTPHGDTIDSHIFSPVVQRGEITFGGNFVHNAGTHDDLTGLQKLFLDGSTFGMLWKGPSWAGDTDEIIMSGEIVSFSRTAPLGAGVYGFECTFRPSGLMKIDGTSYGTVVAAA